MKLPSSMHILAYMYRTCTIAAQVHTILVDESHKGKAQMAPLECTHHKMTNMETLDSKIIIDKEQPHRLHRRKWQIRVRYIIGQQYDFDHAQTQLMQIKESKRKISS